MRRLLLTALLALFACRPRPKPDNILLSYSERNSNCVGCPHFRVEFGSGGHVWFECLAACAVPGQQHHIVPAQRFLELVQAFHDADFFAVPRTDKSRMVTDAMIRRLTYRDDRRIHEVVDVKRQIPRITDLENRMRTATEVDRYLKPSVALYRRLTDSGWDVTRLDRTIRMLYILPLSIAMWTRFAFYWSAGRA